MADRGFSFPEYFAAKGVQLLIPASTRGKTAFRTGSVRVTSHVKDEDSCGKSYWRIKNLSILRKTLPINLIKRRPKDTVSTVDKILLVCSALSNLDKSLIQ